MSRPVDGSEPTVRLYPVAICDGCIKLEGDMCTTPGCAFCWCSVGEVRECLSRIQLRILLDGEPTELFAEPIGILGDETTAADKAGKLGG